MQNGRRDVHVKTICIDIKFSGKIFQEARNSRGRPDNCRPSGSNIQFTFKNILLFVLLTI